MKKWFFRFGLLSAMLTAFVLWSDRLVSNHATDRIYTEVSEIPKNRVGLLLGTIKTLSNGSVNLYYRYRIDATVRLFEAGKID